MEHLSVSCYLTMLGNYRINDIPYLEIVGMLLFILFAYLVIFMF